MARHFDDLLLGSIELFCCTAEAESFTAAAATAGLTPAAVSRSVSRLEARLGVQLFVRTTRRVRLTESGQAYYEQSRQALAQLIDAERELAGEQRLPSGTVRLSLPTSYGHYRILPLIPEFRELFPEIALDIQLSNRNVDFTSEGFDLAVRGRTLADSGLIAHTLENAELIVVASPAYLSRNGEPASIDALSQHECVQFLLPRTGQAVPWLLRKDGQDLEVFTSGSIRCSDDTLGPVSLVRNGAGIVQTYRFVVAHDLLQGTLREVLQQHAGATRPFTLLHPANRHMPRRVRVLIDFLKARLR